jgi:hypothetical protein
MPVALGTLDATLAGLDRTGRFYAAAQTDAGRGDKVRRPVRRWSGLDSATRVRADFSDLAAGHLQSPASTINQLRTTSFLWCQQSSEPR